MSHAWHAKAACRFTNPTEGRDPFFPDDGERRTDWETARAICAGCPVSMQCLADALKFEGTLPGDKRAGFVGGASPAERHRISLGLPAVPKRKSAEKKPRKERSTPIDQAAMTAARVAANNRRKRRKEDPCPADTQEAHPHPTEPTPATA